MKPPILEKESPWNLEAFAESRRIPRISMDFHGTPWGLYGVSMDAHKKYARQPIAKLQA